MPGWVAVTVAVPGAVKRSCPPASVAGPVTASVTGSLLLAVALTATGVASVAEVGALRVTVWAAFAITRVAPALPL